jgi:Flp pilus assembly protein TadG
MSISDAIMKDLTTRDGAAGVEFALTLPAIVLFTIGTVDLGGLAYQKAEVSAAVNAGVLYAIDNASSLSLTNVATAVTGATPLGTSVTPTVTQGYACSNASSISLSSTQPTNCSPGVVATYVQISSSASYTPLISWGTITMPSTLSASAMVRVQ